MYMAYISLFLQAAVQSQGTMQLLQKIVYLAMRESQLGQTRVRKTVQSSALGSKAVLLGHSPLKLIMSEIVSSILCILGL